MFESLRKKTRRIFNWKKKSNINFFLAISQFCVCSLHLYIAKSTKEFEKKLHTPLDLKKVP